jgi:hypothetical protein
VADWQCVGFAHGVLNTDNIFLILIYFIMRNNTIVHNCTTLMGISGHKGRDGGGDGEMGEGARDGGSEGWRERGMVYLTRWISEPMVDLLLVRISLSVDPSKELLRLQMSPMFTEGFASAASRTFVCALSLS